MSPSSDIVTLSAIEMVAAFSRRDLSPVEALSAHLRQCEKLNPEINAVFGVRPEYALANAEKSEKRWTNGNPRGPLDGLPILLKDSVKCDGFDYFHGSAGYSGDPASEDAPPAGRIKSAGGTIFAKTTMPDFGMLASGVSSAFGIIRNPWNRSFNPGGSSAGSAAAVAAGMAPLAVGTDAAGSVRLPAAQCGLVGLKPSRGRIPHLPPSPFRAAGPMARRVADAGLLMSVLMQPDQRDYESAPPGTVDEYRELSETADDFLKGKTVGLLLDAGFGQDPDKRVLDVVQDAARLVETLGADVELIPSLVKRDPMPALHTLMRSRAYYELMSLPKCARPSVLDYVRDWCCEIEQLSAHDLSTALYGLEDFKSDVTETLLRYDFVISPTTTVAHFPAEIVGAVPQDHFAHCSFAIPFNQTGAPAITVPCGFVDDMPVGLQVIGKRFDDIGILRFAHLFEQNRDLEIAWPM